MTPIEVLKEIKSLPLADKRRVFDELRQDIAASEDASFTAEEQRFLEGMKRMGLIADLPARTEQRSSFRPIAVAGEPVSETIVKERR